MVKGLVSVIVPIYNVEKYLPRCIESILQQSYKKIEVILVDDGSTDRCGKLIDEYAKKDKRIVAAHQKNGGQSNARNKGISLAKGEFLSFIDGDDEIETDFIEKLVGAYDMETAIAVCGISYRFLKSGTRKDVYIKRLKARSGRESLEKYVLKLLTIDGRMYSSVNKLYLTETVRAGGLKFQEKLDFAEDTKFVLDYLKLKVGEIRFVLEPLYQYNFGTETSTVKKSSKKWKNWQKSYSNLKKWAGQLNFSGRFWLMMVRLRWQVSWARSLRRR